MSLTLAFYLGTRRENAAARLLDRLICWWPRSRGRFSHVELVLGRMPLAPDQDLADYARVAGASSMEGKIREGWVNLATRRWVLLQLPGFDVDHAQAWFAQHDGARYDWLGLLGFVLPWRTQDGGRWYCSEAIAAALHQAASASDPATPLPWPPRQISPSALHAWCIEHAGASEVPLTPGVP